MDAKARYVAHVLARYQRLPGTLGRVLRDDRRTAGMLHDRSISLAVVEQAFVLGLARRIFRADVDPLEPIRALRYFLPVIQEVLAAPPHPSYLQHLERRLYDAGLYPGR
jgi:hypothetical protein